MKVSASPFEPPIAPASELDSATRESLSRLSTLIRGQLKASEVADQAMKEKSRHDDEQAAALALRNKRAKEGLVVEAIELSHYPAVERAKQKLLEEHRRRGVQVYTQQKTKDAVHQILSALEETQPDPEALKEFLKAS